MGKYKKNCKKLTFYDGEIFIVMIFETWHFPLYQGYSFFTKTIKPLRKNPIKQYVGAYSFCYQCKT